MAKATISVIGGRWKPILACQLLADRKRFSKLARLIPNATQRMITLQLKELEADGIISRQAYWELPTPLEYLVNPLGRTLQSLLEQMQAEQS